MPEPAGFGDGPWFERGDRVRFGNTTGVVQSSFPNGLHHIYIESEHRIVTLPGNMLTMVTPAHPPMPPPPNGPPG